MSRQALEEEYQYVLKQFEDCKRQNLNLNIARGKPSSAQLDLVMDMLTTITDIDDCSSPLAVLAIVEEVALDQNVARAAALIPLEGIGFKLNCCAAAVKVVLNLSLYIFSRS